MNALGNRWREMVKDFSTWLTGRWSWRRQASPRIVRQFSGKLDNWTKSLCCVGLVVLLVSCSRVVNRVSDENDIRESLFRYEFAHHRALGKPEVYFLAIGDARMLERKDPDETLMSKFANVAPRVAKGSEATWSMREGAYDTKTRESGVILFVGAVRWISDSEIRVGGGYAEYGLNAADFIYTLKWKWGRWVITREQMEGVALNGRNKPSCWPVRLGRNIA